MEVNGINLEIVVLQVYIELIGRRETFEGVLHIIKISVVRGSNVIVLLDGLVSDFKKVL